MVYRKIKLSHILITLVALIIPIVIFFNNDVVNDIEGRKVINDNELPLCKSDFLYDESYKDSLFRVYKNKADLYLSRGDFSGSPLNGDILSISARNAFDSTGILVPLELALSQCLWESSMGRRGKSPINNPFNVGEWDDGTVRYFESTFDGVQAYFYLVAKDYLKCKNVDALFINYVNCDGYRYASEDNYEEMVSREYYRIKRWFVKNYK